MARLHALQELPAIIASMLTVRQCMCLAVQARELCAFVEKAHGLCPGWLLSEPQARVRLCTVVQHCDAAGLLLHCMLLAGVDMCSTCSCSGVVSLAWSQMQQLFSNVFLGSDRVCRQAATASIVTQWFKGSIT